MNKYIFICIVLLLATNSILYSQCRSNLSTSQQESISFELSRAINPNMRLSMLETRTREQCMYASQVKALAAMLNTDSDKFTFAKNAYARTIDKHNYYEVYDIFSSYSFVFRLHDAIRGIVPSAPVPVPTPTEPLPTPSMSFPDARYYSGSKGCPLPMTTSEFQVLYTNIELQHSDIARYTIAKSSITGRCISVEQLMKACMLVDNESYRLDLLKSFITTSYDKDNYTFATQLLQMEPYKNDFIQHCISINRPTVPLPIPDTIIPCAASSMVYDEMKNTVKNQSYSSTKVNQIKTFMQTHCFTALQIREFAKLLDYENDRIAIAKQGYDKCIDKSNYFLVNAAFTYSSSVDDLNKFIRSK